MAKYPLILMTLLGINSSIRAQEDKFQWLEEVDGKRALEFVNAQNKATFEKLSKLKDYQSIYDKTLEISNSSDRIAYPSIYGKYVYNFWKDQRHERGIWRRCTLIDYNNGKMNWETLLDIDALSQKDSVKWVYKGANGLYPSYNRFLIELSNGGGDAVYIKEFDVNTKQFVEGGFQIDEAKGEAGYIDENTLIVSTDFGKGSMTTSGYPNQVKIWKRGTSLKEAQLIYEGKKTDVGSWGGILRTDGKSYVFISRAPSMFTAQKLLWIDNKIVTLDIPDDCSVKGILKGQLIIQLKSDWVVNGQTYANGALLSINFDKLSKGLKEVQLIVQPDEFSSISDVSTTKNQLLVNMLTNVTSKLFIYSFIEGKWADRQVKAPDFGTISLISAHEFSDQYFFQYENFITPSTLYAADAGANTFTAIKSLPSYFDASKYEVKQFKARSKDGTMIPYFIVAAKNMKNDGLNPTLIVAYGGFEVSYQPFYASKYGNTWLDKGGVFVLANIRGGGEFGPKWHQDGIKEKRQNVFDDLFAVSEDLITKKITSPKHLGIMGGSNGGLLVGVAFTQRPDLYNAVVCQVPLLDMQRYNKLLAGASWMGEYGNPDIPEEWAYIQKYSPYQNLKAGMKYPEVFFTTSTRDDRVHPGHARKMVAKMNDMGYKTYYYENTEGGHAGSSTNEQSAKSTALMISYLLMKLK
ncbi:prolyl oligopeptidase family serine peptidase [Fluviicola chungangensis]|uniref:S9 family peptidase n=1 Tax=Fluviicola chungangensis TaxID=2597671 RepID=A0A556MNR1_9FLAO|nr:prolyl oligopeptidase family serine peptidase [Fluviicola chungangensis]TSJ41594.1 S9 family peptidase [Fluviicola chungangensis]